MKSDTVGPEVWLVENQRFVAISTRCNEFPLSRDYQRTNTPGSEFIETRRFAVGHKMSRIGCDEVWNSQTHPNCPVTVELRSNIIPKGFA
jgi:hypothetical protein